VASGSTPVRLRQGPGKTWVDSLQLRPLGYPERAVRVARGVRTGTFSVNSFVYNTEAPFGGVKSSGVGRDTGPEAVQAYYELKTVNLTDDMVPLST
jgi:Aldehyde dehydrogenase family